MPRVEPAGAAVVERPRRPARGRRDLVEVAAWEREFVGLKPVPATREQIESPDWEGKIKYWSAATETAWMVSDGPTRYHEHAPHRLAKILERVAQFRGAPIGCLGSEGLRYQGADGELRELMQGDQTVYLHPERPGLLDVEQLVVGEEQLPEVVLEVDNTTDIRRGNPKRLSRYEAWGFLELWVEVPDRASASRPRGLRRGTTSYLLDEGRYRTAESSRAFPGWRAFEIHTALNEPVLRFETDLILERVGRTLGAREGTGPDDDPTLGRFGRKERSAGRARGRAEGVAAMVKTILRRRGIALSPDFPADLAPERREALGAASAIRVAEAAHAAASEADFFARLRRAG